MPAQWKKSGSAGQIPLDVCVTGCARGDGLGGDEQQLIINYLDAFSDVRRPSQWKVRGMANLKNHMETKTLLTFAKSTLFLCRRTREKKKERGCEWVWAESVRHGNMSSDWRGRFAALHCALGIQIDGEIRSWRFSLDWKVFKKSWQDLWEFFRKLFTAQKIFLAKSRRWYKNKFKIYFCI